MQSFPLRKGVQGDVPPFDRTVLPDRDAPQHLNIGACPREGGFSEEIGPSPLPLWEEK